MDANVKLRPVATSLPGASGGRPIAPQTGAGACPADTLALVSRFAPISLAEMEAVALMDRVDCKYAFSLAQLPDLLSALVPHYRALEVDGVRLGRYSTLYYDTAVFDLFACHHAGRSERLKVRSRAYLDSGVRYLEIKRKTNHGRTVKERIRTDGPPAVLGPLESAFVERATPMLAHALRPVLLNAFLRLTLVSIQRSERVTLDLNLWYRAQERATVLAGLVVAEVKQAHADRGSEALAQLRALGLRPTPFSKYCVGVATLCPGIKHNRFMPVLRQIDSLVGGVHYAG